ncbi:MAG: nucleotidyltransferase family protein [Planctomycetes bacterium]|nr:nucleotidyltransferase family protein [Planctomycetota bacterium]
MIIAIVLAAGASSRMGRPKALLPIDGKAAVDVVTATLREGGCEGVVVVVGRHAAEIRAGARLEGVRVVDHAGWAAGRTSSLQAGLHALGLDDDEDAAAHDQHDDDRHDDPASPSNAHGIVLALVDMPYVRAATVRALLDALRASPGAEIAVPVHAGRRGHPVAIRRAVFPRLLALGPDESPRDVLRAARAVEVPVDDPGVLIDLDTPEDVR